MSKKLLALTLAVALAAQAVGRGKAVKPQRRIAHYKGYRLVWHDEFNRDGEPEAQWSYEKGFVRNEEEQWYQRENAWVEGGTLVIEGRRETVDNPWYDASSGDWRRGRRRASYTSASLNTSGSFRFRYGRVEVRAKLPTAPGAWPAIWLLGNQREWPENGEVDIMEYYVRNGCPSVLANACWGGGGRWIAEWNTGATPLAHFVGRDARWADKFHLWRMDWDEERIVISLDGEVLNEVDVRLTLNGRDGFNPFSNDVEGFGHYILLNLALGSSGGAVDEEALPMDFLVDFVRVYQRK